MTSIVNDGYTDVYLPYQGVTLAPGETWTDEPAEEPAPEPVKLTKSAKATSTAPEPAVVETPAPAAADSQE